MAPGKGYVLMNDFTTHPDAFPTIGTIIQDSLRPNERRLSELSTELETKTHSDAYRQVYSSNFDLQADIWARFCQMVQVKIGGHISTETTTVYETQSLDTKYVVQPPDEQDVEERVKEDKVQAAMKAGAGPGKPVFMVTGLKIARGFKYDTHISANQEAAAAAGVIATDQVSAGGELGVSHGTVFEQSVQALEGRENDIVFAYRLHVIASKGWFRKRLEVKPHEHSGGFSSEDVLKSDDDLVVMAPASFEDIQAAGHENEDIVRAVDGEHEREDEDENEDVYYVHLSDDT